MRLKQLQPFVKDIDLGKIKTKREFMEKLGITEDQQKETRSTLRTQLVGDTQR